MSENYSPFGDERVKKIRKRLSEEYEKDIAPHNRMLADIRTLLSLLPAQTVDLSLLPYEIAEELPKIGGEFGKLAAMCKSHVAAFIEKLISTRTLQPAASTPTERRRNFYGEGRSYEEVMDAAMDKTVTGICLPNDLGRCPIHGEIHAAASTEAQDEREFFCYWLARIYEAGHRDTSYEKGETLSEALRNVNQVLGFAGYEPDNGTREALLKKTFRWRLGDK